MTGSSTVVPSFGKNARTSNACVGAGRGRADDADVELADEAGGQGQDGLGALEQDRDPAGAVVGPLRVDDLARGRCRRTAATCSTSASSTGPDRSSGGAANASPSGVRRTVTSPAPHSCTTLSGARVAALQPGVAGPERRVAGERQLGDRREDADAVVGRGVLGRQHERGLGQVGPVREPLHRLGVEPGPVEHHRDRVAEVGHVGEDVDLGERAAHQRSLRAKPRSAQAPTRPR